MMKLIIYTYVTKHSMITTSVTPMIWPQLDIPSHFAVEVFPADGPNSCISQSTLVTLVTFFTRNGHLTIEFLHTLSAPLPANGHILFLLRM
jgi:hypothetical protein